MNSFTQTLADLEVAYARIAAIDRDALSEERRRERANAMRQVRRAINRIDVAVFSSLSEQAKKSAEELEAAAAKLKSDLANVRGAVAAINLVAGTIQAIASLLTLVGV